MKQAKQMQERMVKLQEELAAEDRRGDRGRRDGFGRR